MTEIIARPATGARPSHARKKARPAETTPPQPTNEAEALCRQAVGVVSTLVARAAETSNIPALAPPEFLDEADCLLMEIRDNGAKTRGLVGALQRAYTLLDGAASETPERLSTAVGQAVLASLTISSALTLTKALETAYQAGDLQRLRALGTYQGAMEVAVQGRAGASAAPSPHARTQVHESLGQLAALLKQAARTDEPHAHSGDSDRLLRIGGELAERGAAAVGTPDCEDLAFDIAACVSASSRVPGDTQSPKRAEFIKLAAEVLAVLADTPITDILRAGLAQSSNPTAKTGPSMPGLNLDQLRKVLGRVARDASTLNNLLMAAQATDDGTMLAYLVDGAQALTEKIGGMADQAVEGDVIGDYDSWFFGPNFGQRGGAA
ncbi:hypothetical protein [Delftia lacustris]|uniref:Uncharacterized protein n=1 Tax=Delftia lacustris TaxID=558537 RepID=A0A1H3QSQ2_9BURK|nr:hypothetical protein [Delftia lacustris]SDZ16457.1 hypothetical protein SAMN05421547_113123 [Delftia lacustris]